MRSSRLILLSISLIKTEVFSNLEWLQANIRAKLMIIDYEIMMPKMVSNFLGKNTRAWSVTPKTWFLHSKPHMTQLALKKFIDALVPLTKSSPFHPKRVAPQMISMLLVIEHRFDGIGFHTISICIIRELHNASAQLLKISSLNPCQNRGWIWLSPWFSNTQQSSSLNFSNILLVIQVGHSNRQIL